MLCTSHKLTKVVELMKACLPNTSFYLSFYFYPSLSFSHFEHGKIQKQKPKRLKEEKIIKAKHKVKKTVIMSLRGFLTMFVILFDSLLVCLPPLLAWLLLLT